MKTFELVLLICLVFTSQIQVFGSYIGNPVED